MANILFHQPEAYDTVAPRNSRTFRSLPNGHSAFDLVFFLNRRKFIAPNLSVSTSDTGGGGGGGGGTVPQEGLIWPPRRRF